MVILGLEFLALIVICYLFLVYVTRDRVPADREKRIPNRVFWGIILVLLAMILLASWYIRLGLAS